MKKKILIIEDNSDTAKILSLRLSAEGFETYSAPDALLGIQEAHAFKPDLILVDLMLPGGGGLEVISRLQMSVRTNRTPIIVVTGMAGREIKENVLKCGVAAFVPKPFEFPELLSEIRKALGIS